MLLAVIHQCGDQHLGAIVDAFHLELHELIAALAKGFGGADAFFFYQGLDLPAQGAIADADEAPGLHQADTGGLMRGFEQTTEQFGLDGAAAEVAHVAALGDGAVHRRALGFGECVVAHGLFASRLAPTGFWSGANSAAIAEGFDGK
ncbi:hypothetical protein D9M69_608280 [compost metagenome]